MVKRKKGKRRLGFFRGKSRHRKKDRTIAILPIAGLAYSVLLKPHPWASSTDTPLEKLKNGRIDKFVQDLVTQAVSMTPDMKTFDWNIGIGFWAPILGGFVGHMVMNRIGVNKQVHKIPLLGKYISF